MKILDIKEYGKYIKKRREEIGLSQVQLSAKSGVSLSTLTQIEQLARKDIRIKTLNKILKALEN